MLVHHVERMNDTDIHGNTPLMISLEHNSNDATLVLLSNIDCVLFKCNNTQNCILHIIAQLKFSEEIHLLARRVLEEYPLLVNKKNVFGETPILLACENGNVEYIKFLIRHGACLDDTTLSNKSVLDYALASKFNTNEIITLIDSRRDEMKKSRTVKIETTTMSDSLEMKDSMESKGSKESKLSDDENDMTSSANSEDMNSSTKSVSATPRSPKPKEKKKKLSKDEEVINKYRELLDTIEYGDSIKMPVTQYSSDNKYRILSIDGGGQKCIQQTIIISRLLKRFPQLLNTTCLFCGVSASSMTVCDLAMGESPEKMIELSKLMGNSFFDKKSRGYLEAMYSNKRLVSYCNMKYGDMKLSDLKRNVFINALKYDTGEGSQDRGTKACFFNNFTPDHDCKIADACLRSSAAPGFFAPYQGYVDGGIFENNPVTCAFPFLFGEHGHGIEPSNTVCLSIGAGQPPVHYFDEEKYSDVGLLQLMPMAIDGFMWSRVCLLL